MYYTYTMVNLDPENYSSPDALHKMLNCDIIFQMSMKKESDTTYLITKINNGIRITCPCVRFNHGYSDHIDLPKVGNLCSHNYLYKLASHYNVIYELMPVEISNVIEDWYSLSLRERLDSRKKIHECIKDNKDKYLLDFFESITREENFSETLEEMMANSEYKDKLMDLITEYLEQKND